MKLFRPFLLFAVVATLVPACRKAERFTEASGIRLEFSQDTVLFDTVFTTIGTVTKRFTARNPNSNAVRIDVALEGGQPSHYRINVDGTSGANFSGVEVLGGDSVFIFVEATLGQNGVNDPFIIEDRVLFNTNGTDQSVLLQAYGQDALFYPNSVDTLHRIQGLPAFSYIAGGFDSNGSQICGENVVWTAEKPIVLLNYAVVDSCNSLTIEAGARIYVHGGAGLWVYRGGQITAVGTPDNRITFQGDRLEPQFAELPGQWDRIWINEGPSTVENRFENVAIKNALIGIQCETWPGEPSLPTSEAKLVLNNVQIRNCSAAGILSRNYFIESTNLLVGDCGQYCVALTGGGNYYFDHTTVANYWSFDLRQTPAFYMTNAFQDITGTVQLRDIPNCVFKNGIIYGSNDNEFLVELDGTSLPDNSFQRMLLRTNQATDSPVFQNGLIWRNQDPGFVSVGDRNFRLTSNAFAIEKGDPPNTGLDNIDLDGNTRFGGATGATDLGCYEFTE